MVKTVRCGADSPRTAVNREEFGLVGVRLWEAAISTGTFNKAASICQDEHRSRDRSSNGCDLKRNDSHRFP